MQITLRGRLRNLLGCCTSGSKYKHIMHEAGFGVLYRQLPYLGVRIAHQGFSDVSYLWQRLLNELESQVARNDRNNIPLLDLAKKKMELPHLKQQLTMNKASTGNAGILECIDDTEGLSHKFAEHSQEDLQFTKDIDAASPRVMDTSENDLHRTRHSIASKGIEGVKLVELNENSSFLVPATGNSKSSAVEKDSKRLMQGFSLHTRELEATVANCDITGNFHDFTSNFYEPRDSTQNDFQAPNAEVTSEMTSSKNWVQHELCTDESKSISEGITDPRTHHFAVKDVHNSLANTVYKLSKNDSKTFEEFSGQELTPAQLFLKENQQRLIERAELYYKEKRRILDEENEWDYYRDPVVRPPKKHLWGSGSDYSDQPPAYEEQSCEFIKGIMLTIEQIVYLLNKDQAININVIDMEKCGRRDLAVYAIIATGRNSQHCRMIARNIVQVVRSLEVPYISRATFCCGTKDDSWVTAYIGPVHLHCFTEKLRDHYKLETLYTDAGEHIFPSEHAAVSSGPNDMI